MGPKDKYRSASDFFQRPLLELINHKHPLVKLAELIDWRVFKTRWAEFFLWSTGRPSTSPCLSADLLYLQHIFARSDEDLI